MASIVSKLARAAFATRASRSATVGGVPGGARPAAAIRASSAGGPPKSSSSEEEKARPKSEVAFAANPSQTRDFPLSVPAAPILVSPAGHPMSEEDEDDDENGRLDVDENALKSDEAMWAFYEYWCKYHGISRTRPEMKRRFKFFSKSARAVHSAGGANGPMSMTPLADFGPRRKYPFADFGPRRKYLIGRTRRYPPNSPF